MKPIDIMWVCIGGGIGSLLRWQIGQFIDARMQSSFKYSTLFINITGAFVIAYLSAALAIGWQQRYGDMMSSLVLTGILGGYTTFSTMQLDAVKMVQDKRAGLALVYLAVSVAGGLVAAAAGVAMAKA
jgi:fluoride exporter